jgi:hypothetical protein
MWHTNNYEVQQLQQQEYYQTRRCEADKHRRVKQALRAVGAPVAPQHGALNRLGGYLVAVGERLQAHDATGAWPKSIR